MSFGSVNTFQQYSDDFGLGHNGVRISFNYFDGLPEQSLINALQSNELILIFKSLLKRDVTTKEKALNELMEFINNFSINQKLLESDIFIICWSQVYAKLLVSESKNIRNLSHQVTIKLMKLMNKKIGKFLKDLIPFVLLGFFDVDNSICQTCQVSLLDCFNNDKKKISVLWNVFHEQILNLIRQSIVLENEKTLSDENFIDKDLSQLRYDRLFTSSVKLLNNLLLENSEDNTKIKKFKSEYKEILSNEQLWNQLTFKSLNNLKSSESLLILVKTLFDIKYLPTHKEVLKFFSKRLLKVLPQINSKNAMSFSIHFSLIIDVLTLLDDYKDGKVWSYDKSSKSKLFDFLTIASLNPVPGVFEAIFKFYVKTKEQNLLDRDTQWTVLWSNALNSMNDKTFLGRYGAQVYFEYWKFYLPFLDNDELIRDEIAKSFTNKKLVNQFPGLVSLFTQHLKSDFVLEEINKSFSIQTIDASVKSKLIQNLTIMLLSFKNAENELHSLCEFCLNIALSDPTQLEGNNSDVIELYRILIKSNVSFLYADIEKFFNKVQNMISSSNFNNLSNLLILYSNSSNFTEESYKSEQVKVFQAFFDTSRSLDLTPQVIYDMLSKVNKHILHSILSSPESKISEYVLNFIRSYNFEDDGHFMESHLITEANIIELYRSALTCGQIPIFCKYLSQMSPACTNLLFTNSDFLETSYLKHSDETSDLIFNIAISSVKDDDGLSLSLAKAIIREAKESFDKTKKLYLEHAVKLINTNVTTVLKEFFPSDVTKLIDQYICNIDERVALVNVLKMNSHLLSLPLASTTISDVEELIRFGLFLDSLVEKVPDFKNDRIQYLLTLIFEIASDFNCISDNPVDTYISFNNTIFKADSVTVNFEEVVDCLMTGKSYEDTCPLIDLLINHEKKSNPVVLYYWSKALFELLLNAVDSISISKLKGLLPTLEKFISKTIRSKSNEELEYSFMVSAVVLMSLEKFTNSEEFTRLRTLLASELIGTNGTELVNSGYKSVILLTNLLHVNGAKDDFTPIAPQRLNMVINSISKILDTDLIYEESFSVVRLSILNFFDQLLRFPALQNIDHSVIIRFIADSLSMCQLDDTPYLLELRYTCLKSYERIQKFETEYQSSEYVLEISDSLIELCLIEFPNEGKNQISMNFYNLLSKIIFSVNTKTLIEFYDRFLERFLQDKKEQYNNQNRLLVIILEKLIHVKQQDAIVEYEFRKQDLQNSIKQSDDDSDNDENSDESHGLTSGFELPQLLVDNLKKNVPQEYLEYENEISYINYLWDWHLSLSFFQDISYNLRQLYIEQLKKDNLIDIIYNFIGDQVDLEDTEFWKELENDSIVNYRVDGEQFSPYKDDIMNECKILLVHLTYKLFINFGAITSNWFLNIKDRSLQNKIEKFVSTYVSPILILHELQDVSSKMDRLTSKDDSLDIKINEVTKEVKARYLIDEQKLEISFKLPSNYPLTNVQVIGVSRVGISEQKWKQWIMSTQSVITNMNGSVMDSLELFTKNVNLQFSGFEECAICYSILHAVDRKLPTKTCPTCRNKFHGACLYKWFRSSGNNTCPMCRSEIAIRR
ncbi:hypothetical protein Kpol_480p25 [Vanderwaltozyma polyspora DSM 70294]|uniref:E3 ubiquitin-protein ligase listerin n=1 Tax=Vanderwaltozyma polyspora (strain ATCC 22028 / DSM 70294 / BCRC 21397 / CBS 2163 / NBRC 10782 / NRRL Y-8283 / UCD 57-17) TaxID=436907 RepID=A7TP87_VANPO|nr:uncharacterized protein Kpol_480p25 [Vanderwaltozyma polyspora DSM 70294]EDO15938.1 hypothetical protein Kpol_480p25 [Vanderwaltozyma polyspora DSM 70294]